MNWDNTINNWSPLLSVVPLSWPKGKSARSQCTCSQNLYLRHDFFLGSWSWLILHPRKFDDLGIWSYLQGQGHYVDVAKICAKGIYFHYYDTFNMVTWIGMILYFMLHDILDDDHPWWSSIDQALHQFLTRLLIWTLLLNLTFYYLIARGFHRTFAMGAACQQRTLSPPDTWSCPTVGLARVLMLRPISPELVLSPDFWISNISRYFWFCFLVYDQRFYCMADKA